MYTDLYVCSDSWCKTFLVSCIFMVSLMQLMSSIWLKASFSKLVHALNISLLGLLFQGLSCSQPFFSFTTLGGTNWDGPQPEALKFPIHQLCSTHMIPSHMVTLKATVAHPPAKLDIIHQNRLFLQTELPKLMRIASASATLRFEKTGRQVAV